MAYLDDHPPARSQFRCPRREAPSGVVVVHTAESTPDTVATDGGAEAVARFIAGRSDPGSYHDLADSDSCIQLVRYECEAFHDGTGSNPHSYGVSAATTAAFWPLAPAEWRNGCVRQMAAAAARYATWLYDRGGIVIPARRISRAQSEARMPGFISHAERDPARRTDPGAQFPWATFLATYAEFTNQEDDVTEAEMIAAVGQALDSKARRVTGISSFEQLIGLTYEYARDAKRSSESNRALISGLDLTAEVDPVALAEAITAAGVKDAVLDALREGTG